MGNKVLVTGATGFVGRKLCAELVSRGKGVIGVGRRSGGNIVPSGVTYHRLDLEAAELNEFDTSDVGCIIHLAGQAHGKGGRDGQGLDSFRRMNVDVSLKLASLAIEAGVRRFVFVSSIGVHGTVTNGKAITENAPFEPSSPYTLSKMEAELELIKLFKSAPDSELTIVRPPLVYGVDAPGNFGSLIKLADSSFPLPFGVCDNRRSLVSITRLVDFLIACACHPAAGGQCFVVADSSVVSTREIVASLRAGMGRAGRLVAVPRVLMASVLGGLGKRDMFTQLFCDLEIDNRKARTVLDWVPCEDTAGELEIIGKLYADSHI
ncbi:NAD-dependent epimerase/dehydratase family protein [Marinobacter sediminicola]|uniref:NAD-dependent epimerase/dehydratase family protein n=1 Tax=Marinobacter sediminicola TaxID=3072994 RepID=UPI0028127726|nr:NAD-dependent epimerase/dehydratase family protein [Marinobacter sp. F26243]